MTNDLVSYQPTNLVQLEDFSKRLAQSGIVPQQYRGKPNDVFVACMWGWETAELTPMTALAYIDVIQGRAAYKSEGLVAIALRKGYITDVDEEFVGKPGSDDYAAVCTVTKKNGKTLQRRFSVADAKAAGLYGKDNWKKWLDRMLIARARGFAVRDAAPHAMLSYTAEEVRDFGGNSDRIGLHNAKDVTPSKAQPVAAPELVALYDQWGTEYLIQPGEVGQWINDAIDGATAEELESLIENNPACDGVLSIVDAALLAMLGDEENAVQATASVEDARPNPTANGGKTAKQRAKEIAAAFKDSPTLIALNNTEERVRADMTRLPDSAKSKLAQIFHERRMALTPPPDDTEAAIDDLEEMMGDERQGERR